MALFGSGAQRNDSRNGAYSPVGEDEGKPLQERDISDSEHDAYQVPPEIFALSRSLRRTNLFLKIIIGLLCITIIALLSMNVPDTLKKIMKQTQCLSQQPLLKTPVPDLGKKRVVFEKHHIFSQRPNEISDQAWNALLPSGRGFVYIKDWEKYDLPPGQNTTWGMIYSTALFHQMHCLGQLRRFSWMFLDAIADNDTEKQAQINNMFIKMDHKSHMNHCFDYLRQTIQCAGDMSMEWPRTEPTGERIAVDGWDIPHECVDWDVVMKYMDENHFEHSMVAEIAPLAGSGL